MKLKLHIGCTIFTLFACKLNDDDDDEMYACLFPRTLYHCMSMTVVWAPYTVKDTEALESVQRRFTKRLKHANLPSQACLELPRLHSPELDMGHYLTDPTRPDP